MSRDSKTERPGALDEAATFLRSGASDAVAREPEFDLLVSTASAVSAVRLRSSGTYIVGRSHEADIVLHDASVSRRHARLRVSPEGVSIEDLGSSNGSRVGGRVLAAGRAELLSVGTVVELGSATLVVQRGRGLSLSAATQQSPPPPAPSAQSRRIVLDPTMQHLYAMLDLVAPTTLSVLVLGETGVGKEVFAREIHERSTRARSAYLQLNCAALPPSTLEAELFGFEKGAFTGALAAKPGLFEVASGGTVFLDEVGDMPLATQVKILRVLESGDVLRVGSVKPIRVDIRLIAATNRDLAAAMAAGEFRSDLYFRLNGMTFTLPPLRQRPSEIVPLARHFVETMAARLGRRPPSLGPGVPELLEALPWPGNARELRNVVERAIVLAAGGPELLREHFPVNVAPAPKPGPSAPRAFRTPPAPTSSPSLAAAESAFPLSEPITGRMPALKALEVGASAPTASRDLSQEVRELERQRILEALEAARGNQSQAARALGISRGLLIGRMKLFGLSSTRSKRADDDP